MSASGIAYGPGVAHAVRVLSAPIEEKDAKEAAR
jgi:alanine-glyoxylate transaminase/serine-glyoxylate transaminase/serine-pyruvate transaminase